VVDTTDQKDVEAVNARQDAIKVEQPGGAREVRGAAVDQESSEGVARLS